jgi:hypothetical protein
MMKFNELFNLVGRRTDSPEVTSFAEANGIKLPLKHTTDSNNSQYFSLKAYGVEVSWGHDVLHTDFYPSKKENKKYISYITTIWFNKQKIEELPHGLLANDSFDAAVLKLKDMPHEVIVREHGTKLVFPAHNRADIVITWFDDDERGTIELKTNDRYGWLKSEVRAHAFSPWDNRWPNEQSDLPNGMFMAWCIQRGWVGQRHIEQHPQLVEAVKQSQMTGREFLYQTAFCNEFWSHDLAPELERFAHSYLKCLCHRNSSQPLLGRADRCGVDDDFMAVFDPLFTGRGLQAADDWTNYDRFALFLDARWYDYQQTALQTDVEDSGVLANVKAFYKAQQLKMQALPAAVELQAAPAKTENHALPNLPNLPNTSATTLLSFLGRSAEDADIQAFLTIYGLSYPSVSWSTYVDAPNLGLFLGLNYPWDFGGDRFKTLVDEKEQARMKRKKIKFVEQIYFTNTGYEQVSNSTGNYLLCQQFLPPLPFSLSWDMQLQDFDQRFGEDYHEEHTWDTYENDGSLSRRWEIDLNGKLFTGGDNEPHYLLLVEFVKFKCAQIRMVVR